MNCALPTSHATQRRLRTRLRSWKSVRQRLARFATVLVALAGASLVGAQDISKVNSPDTRITVDVRLVNLNVTVTDRMGHAYTALKADNFRVYDNGIAQVIHHFNSDDVPFTMGLILDRSGSMFMMMKDVYQAAFHTIINGKAEDEFFVTAFNEQSRIEQDFSTDRSALEQTLRRIEAGGATALYDAILEGVDHIQGARHDKKALLVVTDGADNSSTHRFEEVLERARKESVALYIVGMFDKWSLVAEGTNENRLKKSLTELAEATGGEAYFPRNIKECEQACITVARELRQQYALGYYPSLQLQDGSWHKLEVQLNLDKDMRDLDLKARTRAGYYAPRGSEQ